MPASRRICHTADAATLGAREDLWAEPLQGRTGQRLEQSGLRRPIGRLESDLLVVEMALQHEEFGVLVMVAAGRSRSSATRAGSDDRRSAAHSAVPRRENQNDARVVLQSVRIVYPFSTQVVTVSIVDLGRVFPVDAQPTRHANWHESNHRRDN
ncbi:hypothetical protein [Virgisporangium aurantiacum]|uniref:Uncharacterized protein n=1 Tax=Virgisporangium aurantiacum TaxID=175570 RepID=A0A8J4E7V6_9ACTN|nr:hypothetical protein [Virgisporangium aurantiacum]GIJ62157.1 hypothetical protein Vau01_096730 [Virgisporangium aurantiacum]